MRSTGPSTKDAHVPRAITEAVLVMLAAFERDDRVSVSAHGYDRAGRATSATIAVTTVGQLAGASSR